MEEPPVPEPLQFIEEEERDSGTQLTTSHSPSNAVDGMVFDMTETSKASNAQAQIAYSQHLLNK